MASLSVIIPARCEEFLGRTVDDLVAKMRGDTEVIVICDGGWPDPPLADHPRVTVLHYTESIGQRAAVNAGARLSQADYVMKLDAHCMVDEGFDVKLAAPYESGELTPDTTTIPRMYNIYAFDWVCPKGHRRYQSPSGPCLKCGLPTTRDMIWRTRLSKKTDFARFDQTMQFKYWRDYKTRPEAQGELVDVMSSVGACFFMRRDRFWALGGMDEAHGSWGQFGTEIACKSWLSGGRQIVNRRTWIGHLFRTQGGDFGFPYPISDEAQERAKVYSRDLWLNDKWPMAVRSLSWLTEKFRPVPGWHDAPTTL